MKVAVIDSLIGNDYSLCLCKHLNRIGAKVTYIVPQNRKINIPVAFSVKYWAPAKDNSYGKLKKTYHYFKYLAKLTMYLLKSDIDVVHYQFFRRERPESFVFFLQSLLGFRLIYTAHNILPHENSRLDYFFKYLVYKSATTIIVHSTFIKMALLRSFNVKESRIHVIPHGNFDHYLNADSPSKQEARNSLRLSKTDHVLLFFGYIREYKGLDLLLDAFVVASKVDKQLKLLIAGRPHTKKLKDFYAQKIAKISNKDRIIANFQFVHPEDIAKYFIASDIVALPYKNIYHSGIMHLAFTFGKPVIATKVGDFEEALGDGKSGFLVEADKIENMAQTINKAFTNEPDLLEMGEHVRLLSETKYSWKTIAAQTLKSYNGLIKYS